MKKQHIGLIFGPNGVGKGTLAVKLAMNFNYIHLNTGTLIRNWIKNEMHPELQEVLDSGDLISDNYMKEILDYEYPRMALNRKTKNIILEGLPRRQTQVELLTKFCDYHNYKIRWIIVLEAPLEILLERVQERVLAPDGNVYHLRHNPPPARYLPSELQTRPDDRPEIVSKRYEEYIKNTTECITDPFFKGTMLKRIDGTQSIDEVYSQAANFVNEVLSIEIVDEATSL